jgi:hypothetical protein
LRIVAYDPEYRTPFSMASRSISCHGGQSTAPSYVPEPEISTEKILPYANLLVLVSSEYLVSDHHHSLHASLLEAKLHVYFFYFYFYFYSFLFLFLKDFQYR